MPKRFRLVSIPVWISAHTPNEAFQPAYWRWDEGTRLRAKELEGNL